MNNYTPGYDRQVPKNLLEVAHEETGRWLNRDELETWVFRRFQRLEQQIKRLEEEHEAKVIQNVQLMRERDALAAHVERYRAAHVKLTNAEFTHCVDSGEHMRLVDRRLMDEFDAIGGDAPTASLAVGPSIPTPDEAEMAGGKGL